MSIDGTWNGTLNGSIGKHDVQIVLTSAGANLSGRLSAPMGEAEVQDGRVDGETARWKCSVSKPVSLTLEFTVEANGDALSGEVKLGFFGKAQLSGTRAQDGTQPS